MFPEAGIRTWETSVLNGGAIKPGIARLAETAGVPVIPAVVLGSGKYAGFWSWAPLQRTRIGIAFGEPLRVRQDENVEQARRDFLDQLTRSMRELAAELTASMGPDSRQ